MDVELHVRSAFSFLRGASLPEDLVQRAAELGITTLGLIDHDGLYGAPRFYRAARAAGVRPVVGANIPVADGTLGGRLALLVTDRGGYQNLCGLITLARLRVTKSAAREGAATVTLAELAAHKDGLVAVLTATDPPLAALSVRSLGAHRDTVTAWARAVVSVFGQRDTVVELGRHMDRGEERRTQRLVALAASLGIAAVVTGDARYAAPGDAALHDVLGCIREHVTVEHAGRKLLNNHEWYLRAPAETARIFSDHPRALRAARALAARCEFTLGNLGYAFPECPLDPGETAVQRLHRLVREGARERYRPVTHAVNAQLDRELALIEKLDLAGYFLIVWDIVRFCRERGILVQGRGSAANSAVCYCLRITAVDPVGLGLLFERFLSEERGEWPDIDMDLPSGDRREAVIQYVYSTYGERGAAMTANVITYRGRSAVREVGRALGVPEEVLGKLSRSLHGGVGDREGLTRAVTDAGLSTDDHRMARLVSLAARIQDLPRHLGQHSGGMVVARGRLDHVVPLEPAAMPGRVVIQWDKDDCADLGILKIDLLGLGMMAVLEDVVTLVRDHDGDTIDLGAIPHDDPETYAVLRRADTIGLFQVESRAQMATLPRMQPTTFYDLVIEVALIRPGPIVGGLVHPYLARRAGREAVTYPHPSVEPILRRTLGIPLFQEQLMRVAMVAAGFTGGEAEELRRAMGSKRSIARMAALEVKLRAGMTRNGLSDTAQDEIVRGITSFALYGFPESHSASFALLAYASAYLKTHYPASYTAALLNNWPMGFYHPATVVKDAQRHGVRMLPIDVTRSSWPCTREGPAVRLGLRYVRGLRESTGRAIETARTARPFASLDDFRRRCAPTDAELETLAELGALMHTDARHPWHRREALWQVRALAAQPPGIFAAHDLPRDDAPVEAMDLGARIAADYRTSGLSVGPHPVALWRERLRAAGVVPTAALSRLRHGARVSVAGAVITRQRPETAKGFFFITLEDETGLANGIVEPILYGVLRRVLVTSAALVLHGVLQHQDGVVSVKVSGAEALSVATDEGPDDGLALPPAHDFR